jgi:hypothetical protein
MNERGSKRPNLGLVIGLCLVSIVVCAFGLVIHVNRAGNEALHRSDQAFDSGELENATRFARQAATWYLPKAPHVEAAYARLRAIAVGAEATGDTHNALRAWGSLRGALIETAHPWDYRGEAMAEASRGVVRLLLVQQAQSDGRFSPSANEQADLHARYATPAREPGRNWFGLLTSIGMFLMLVCGGVLLSQTSLGTVAASLSRTGFLVGLVAWTFAALGQ